MRREMSEQIEEAWVVRAELNVGDWDIVCSRVEKGEMDAPAMNERGSIELFREFTLQGIWRELDRKCFGVQLAALWQRCSVGGIRL